MSTPFEELLAEIAAVEMGGDLDEALLADLHALLEDSRLDDEERVPGWLMRFFTALRQGETLPLTPQPDERTGAAVGEFFSSLQDLAPFDCLDDGEWIRVRLARLGMLGFLSIEQGAYLVMPLAQAPDDGVSDLSRAKLTDRP